MSNKENPLKSYFRSFKSYVELPSSKFEFYTKNILDHDSSISKEIGVRPMTALDELTLKDPDALLNGEAIKSILVSCVPAVKDPGKLFINDVNVLLATARAVSLGNEMAITVTCPACKTVDDYVLDLGSIAQATDKLEKEYVVVHDKLRVYVKPHTLDAHLTAMHISFEESKLIKVFEDHEKYSDIERIKAMSSAINRIGRLNFDQISSSIVKIVLEDGTEVSDVGHIAEFIANVDNQFSKAVEAKVNEISKIGLAEKTHIQCNVATCEHIWEEHIGFNPTDFFTPS